MMNRLEKSDSAIVATKSANNGHQCPAESVEPRAGAEGNPKIRSRGCAQKQVTLSQAADRIREAVERDPNECLVALLHHITPYTLAEACLSLRRDAAAGVDGVTWETYVQNGREKILDLHKRIHKGTYRVPPVRRVEIPKPDGGTRPLGIAALEDKIVQKVVTDMILTPIFESEFLGFSYGFRPGRGAHNALDALAVGIQQRKVRWILDADIRKFFDSLDRNWLVQFLEQRIGDRRLLRLITKWLNAGVMEGIHWTDTGRGVTQGHIVSPILANVYLHYVFDLWMHKHWRKRYAKGDTIVIRYADDFVVGFQYKVEADAFLADLRERMTRFGLHLHPDKTRLIEFGRYATANRKTRGLGKPDTFDFLGMTHFCDRSRKGRFRVGRRPIGKRVRRTLERIKELLYARRHEDRNELAKWLGRVINGWLKYYAVPGTFRHLAKFILVIRRMFLRTLRRRSQKDRTSWAVLDMLGSRYWPKPSIRHPWPNQRLIVST